MCDTLTFLHWASSMLCTSILLGMLLHYYYHQHTVQQLQLKCIVPNTRRIRGNESVSSEKTMFNNSPFYLHYNTLTNEEIIDVDIGSLSDCGLLFLWVINSQMQFGMECMNKWGYTYTDRVCGVVAVTTQ
jgi:N6-adenosine-specific RNA methylase IME4